jgi:hypothetical protein
MAGGSASALSFRGLLKLLLALRLAESLGHPKATFVARLQPSQLPGQAELKAGQQVSLTQQLIEKYLNPALRPQPGSERLA